MAIPTNYSSLHCEGVSPQQRNEVEPATSYGAWMEKEQTALPQLRLEIAKKYWDTYIFDQSPDLTEGSKLHILRNCFCNFSNDAKMGQKFDDAIEQQNFSQFLSLLDHFNIDKLDLFNALYKDKEFKLTSLRRPLSQQDQEDLKRYMKDINFSGVVCLSDGMTTYRFASEKFENLDEAHTNFSMHSVGKVYTGMLVLSLMEQGVITEEILDSPLELDEATKASLQDYPAVLKRLEEVKMRDLMVHEGGLGDYLGKYDKAIQKALANQSDKNSPPLTITRLEELLPYAEEKVYPPGEERYSNLGILLVGLSIQHRYNQKYKTALSYGEILRKEVLIPAKVTHFSEQEPPHACYNASDATSHYYVGTPAGGYWTSAEDLLNFGVWVNQKGQNPAFRSLLDRYGKEFCNQGVIWHTGGTPSASACLQTSLDNKFSVAILSDQEGAAIRLELAIEDNLLKP